ncbi:ferrous iron transporter B [Janthinobacterium sp. Mn2066]|uniref:ferrous iron transporter B n=1 Tax=Janthinobacterium sp. Mn2066 TaxID=3395264 RepID=UPI003BE8E20D
MGAVETSVGSGVQKSPQHPQIALLGNPNCGKTALFNRLTGARQKVANYAGVTIERKEGHFTSPAGKPVRVLDLPGAYSLSATTPDEAITRDVVGGMRKGDPRPDAIICVVDATNLRLNLRLVLEVQRLGLPMLLSLNMTDVARKRGMVIDAARLSQELGMPVVETVAVQHDGEKALLAAIDAMLPLPQVDAKPLSAIDAVPVEETQREVRRILSIVSNDVRDSGNLTEKIDNVVLHPVFGPIILAVLMFLIFQAVFTWATTPMDMITDGMGQLGALLTAHMPDGYLKSLLVEGVIGGAGSVLVFLPQILILFFFILSLEDCGYLPRAAFLLDRMMGGVGLSGRAFIPLLSSFACAIPGVMAARTIQNPRDRLVTIMIAPLMTCSARLPVYALIIAAFIPERQVWGFLSLQGLVLFTLYFAGIVSAMAVAWIMKRGMGTGGKQALLLELPSYHWPHLRNLAVSLWERAKIFLTRVGTIILTLMIILWFLSTFPGPPDHATHPPIYYSMAGILGRGLEVIFAPIGFNWQICIALVPGMAAREVAVGALGTVYALSQTGDSLATALSPLISQSWPLSTALSLLAWYVFAPQCLSTLSVVKRETGGWRYPLIMAGYMFALAYGASFITYRVALMFGA